MKKCSQCGSEMPDDARFCRLCGAKLEEVQKQESSQESSWKYCPKCKSRNLPGAVFCQECGYDMTKPYYGESQGETVQKGKKKKRFPVVIGVILVALCLLVGAAFFLFAPLKGKLKGKGDSWSLKKVPVAENYQKSEEEGMVDLSLRDHQPSARDFSAIWDKQLFYWLEDAGGSDSDDNHIADCKMERMTFQRTDNGHQIEYEVYSNRETGAIYKIVSIEVTEENTLELTDYYYMDEKPNFVFRRNDTVYTPTYASIDKVGERYYFNNDQMVKWRWIYEPSVVNQWVLSPEDTWYTQWAYQDIFEGERAQYDEKEKQILNEAYLTYEAVTKRKPASLIEGKVVDENGDPVEEAFVAVGRVEDGEANDPEVKLETDENGYYAWEIPDLNASYYIVCEAEGFEQTVMKIYITPDMNVQMGQENLILFPSGKNKEKQKVTLHLYQFQTTDEEMGNGEVIVNAEKDVQLPLLSDGKVEIYKGKNVTFGTPLITGEVEDGICEVELPDGIYTVLVSKKDMASSAACFTVLGKPAEETVYCMKTKEDASWDIVLTWNSSERAPIDLDSCLFTPDKAAGGDRNCINTLNRRDNDGNQYLCDGRGISSCEVIRLSDLKQGSYRYYVSSYSDVQKGSLDASSIFDTSATVSVYKNGVLVKTFEAPKENGVIWEVFEIRNENITPIQNVYSQTEGKTWWTEDKDLARINSQEQRAEWIQSDGEWLYFANPYDRGKIYYCRKDGSNLTKISDDETTDSNILLDGEYIYYTTYETINGSSGIIRIKNDGTEKTVIKDGMFVSEGDGSSLWLEAIYDGILYYWNAPETFGSISLIDTNAIASEMTHILDEWNKKEFLLQAVTITANDIYYTAIDMDRDWIKNFSRKPLSSENDVLLEASTDLSDLTIEKGHLYGRRAGGIVRINLDGSGEEMIIQGNISDMTISGGQIYYRDDASSTLCAANLDGSGNHALIQNVDKFVLLDGEIYMTDSLSKWNPIRVCDVSGGDLRQLFSTDGYRDRAANETYAEFLQDYTPNWIDTGDRQYMQFACEDIDGDGIKELFVQGPPRHPYSLAEYYRYENNSIKKVWDLEAADGIYLPSSGKQMIVYYYGGGGSAHYNYFNLNGSFITDRSFYSTAPEGSGQSPEDETAYYNATIRNTPSLKFVDATWQNIEDYIRNGKGTGFNYD